MISSILSLFLVSPIDYTSFGGVYCDAIMEEIVEYQRDTGAFSRDQLKSLLRNCENWEERYEEAVEAGEVEEIED